MSAQTPDPNSNPSYPDALVVKAFLQLLQTKARNARTALGRCGAVRQASIAAAGRVCVRSLSKSSVKRT
jgi:hypothetical protein